MPPGTTVALPSLLPSVRPGVGFSGVVSLPLALVPPVALAVAVLASPVVPAGTVFSTVTAKATEPFAPAARLPIVRVQVVPAAAPFAQLQPPLFAASNVVLAGTVSLSVTPVRPILPVLT